jgi:hypothetical protein
MLLFMSNYMSEFDQIQQKSFALLRALLHAMGHMHQINLDR